MLMSDDAKTDIPETIYCLQSEMAYRFLDIAEDALGQDAATIARMELEGSTTIDPLPDDPWRLLLYFHHKPDIQALETRLALLKETLNTTLTWKIQEIEKRDWVSEQQHVDPIHVPPFFLHHPLYSDAIPKDCIAIEVRAGHAFGTGEHETTQGCLEAIASLPRPDGDNLLDLGCGTGVLAIAMSKIWNLPAMGTDIEAEAVESAREHAKANHADTAQFYIADGLSHAAIQARIWDVITANVLAKPLISWADGIKDLLAPGGYLIISGFLEYQEEEILTAYRHAGLTEHKRLCHNGWVTWTLKSPA